MKIQQSVLEKACLPAQLERSGLWHAAFSRFGQTMMVQGANMSAQRQHVTHWTLEEYLDFENHSNGRHEFFQGGIYAMAGSPRQHNIISSNVVAFLHSQLRGRPCSVCAMDQRLRVEEADLTTYPDVLVVCPPEQASQTDRIAITDATVLVEVLSPSTAQYDRTSKFDFYSFLPSFLPSLRHYVLIEQNRVEVEHRFREDNGQWTARVFENLEDEIELAAIECRLILSEIYEEIQF